MSRTYRKAPYDAWDEPLHRPLRDGEVAGPRNAPSWFRRQLNAERRAKERQAVRCGREVPRFRRNVMWLWY